MSGILSARITYREADAGVSDIWLAQSITGRVLRQIAALAPWLAGAAVLALGLATAFGQGKLALSLVAGMALIAGCLGAAYLSGKVIDWIGLRQQTSLRTIMMADPVASVLSDNIGRVLYCNGAALARFGPAPKLSLSQLFRKDIADPAPLLWRMQERAKASGHAQEDVVTYQGHLRLTAIRLKSHLFLWRCDNMLDQTVFPRSELTVDLAMLTVGQDGAILSMNGAARQLIGTRVTSLDRLSVDLPLKQGQVHRISTVQGQIVCLVIETSPLVGRREIYLLPMPMPARAIAASLQLQDASGRRQVDTDNHEGWRFFDALPVPLLKLDPSGEVILSNRPARDLLGFADGAPQRLSDLMEGLGRSIADWLADAAAGKTLSHSEFLRLTRVDNEVFVQVTLNPVQDHTGKIALIAVLTDATELKTLEAQFVQSQKMQAIGELAGGIAHDFNNLLTAISGHCDLLLLRHDQGDPDFADLVQIHQNANRAAALVGQLLAFSRKQTLRPEVLDLRDTLADLTHLLNRLVGEKITLTLNHEPVQQTIRADKRQLEQVLMNLVVNARDAMRAGGEIIISTEGLVLPKPVERDRVTLPSGSYVSVKVSDCGHGIPADKLQKVFEPFYTTKRTGEGTGLGLSTAYGIVKQSGGYIFVDSVVGEGTCFTLLFPGHDLRAVNGPLSARPNVTGPNVRHGDGVVLLVEDEAPVRAFASRALRLRGYTVIEADSAEQALKTLEDPALHVDLFVTDVIMPGMDGPTWVRQAMAQRPNVRVVFVSGYAEESFGETQAMIPNSVFLPKPFSLNDLTETVSSQLA